MTTVMMPGAVRSEEFRVAAGLTYRQLDHWTRYGVLTPIEGTGTSSGNYRQFRVTDIPVAKVLARFSKLVSVASGPNQSAAGMQVLATLAWYLNRSDLDYRGHPLFVTPDGVPFMPSLDSTAVPPVDCVFLHRDVWS